MSASVKFDWLKNIVHADLLPTTRLVGVALANYARGDGTNAHPGARGLADDLWMGERTVRGHLHALLVAGWLRLEQKGSTSPVRSWADRYALTIPLDHRQRRAGGQVQANAPTTGSLAPTTGSLAPTTGNRLPPNRTSTTELLQHSDSYESGSAQAPTAHDQPEELEDEEQGRANDEELEAALEWIDGQLDGLDGSIEESTANGMLASGANPKTVVNKISADRSPVA